MHRLLVLGAVFLTACSKAPQQEANVCLAGQSVFTAENKVHINPGEAHTVAGVLFHLSPTSHSQNENEVHLAGTELTAVLKNQCAERGVISSRIKRDANVDRTGGVHSYRFALEFDTTLDELKVLAASDPCLVGISSVALDRVTAVSSDPLVRYQDHFVQLHASEAYAKFLDSKLGKRMSTTIAIIDTGVDIDHVDLTKNVWINDDEIPGNQIDDDRNGYVDDYRGYNFANSTGDPRPLGTWLGNFHGTHVAGLAAARSGNRVGISGVMGVGAKIMALNVFGSEPAAFSFNTENAIRYAVDNGADIINMSIGGTTASASYKSAIQYAVSRGVTVIAAAGNDASAINSSYFPTPAAYGTNISGMITIGSVDTKDSGWSEFSNYGSNFVELAAPGSEDSRLSRGLLSTLPDNAYGRLQGTSMSAPIASGAAALSIQLLRALGYAATPSRIENAMINSSDIDREINSKVRGGRILNLNSLSNYILNFYPKKEVAEIGASARLSQSNAPLPCL